MTFSKAFVISAAAAFAASAPGLASANFQRYSGAFCAVSNTRNLSAIKLPFLNDSTGIAGNNVSHGLTSLDAGSPTALTCPIIDTEALPHANVKQLNVHGFAASSTDLQAKACWTTFNANSGSCTAAQSATGSFPNQIVQFLNSSGVFSGAGSGDFTYVFVQLGVNQNGSIRGYYTQDF